MTIWYSDNAVHMYCNGNHARNTTQLNILAKCQHNTIAHNTQRAILWGRWEGIEAQHLPTYTAGMSQRRTPNAWDVHY